MIYVSTLNILKMSVCLGITRDRSTQIGNKFQSNEIDGVFHSRFIKVYVGNVLFDIPNMATRVIY